MEYRHRRAKPVVSEAERQQAGVMMADVLDARELGSSSEFPLIPGLARSTSLQELREATRLHARRSGLIADDGSFVAAPTDVAELAQTLAGARDAGAKVLLLVRLEDLYAEGRVSPALIFGYLAALSGILPAVVLYSLPLNRVYAFVRVRAYLVEPATGRVLASFVKSTTVDDKASTGWDHRPPKELPGAMFKTMEQVFEHTATLMGSRDLGSGSSTTIDTVLFASPWEARG
jgi:hypothetical protein